MKTEEEVRAALAKLVSERDTFVRADHTRRIEQQKEIEKRAQQSISDLNEALKAANIKLEPIIALEAKKTAAAKTHVEKLSKTLKESTATPVNDTAAFLHGSTFSSHSFQYLTPYYTKVYNWGGGVYYHGYYGGNVKLWDDASGSGWGWFGSGKGEFEMLVDRWFYFVPDESRYYSYYAYLPHHGYYIVYADDGWSTSKYAKAKIDGYVRGYQYNWKPSSPFSVFDDEGSNINDSNRVDNTTFTYYSDLLGGGDIAFALVTERFYVSAQGDGSHAELNFSAETANYLPPPYIWVG